ncbi:MAG: hypothetical protein LIO62_01130 [Clostridiales bacterium]|nr:hypothetical protein [Clostridiales bacterium]
MKINKDYKVQDFSYLINDNENSDTLNSNKILTHTSNNTKLIDYKKIRQDKLSNQKLKYVYSNSDFVYHDRECGLAKKIPDEEFEMTSQFSDDYTWCNSCYKFAIIRCGIQNDAKLFEQYAKYFKLVKADKQLLHFLIVENNAKLWILSSNMMEFKVNEDSWRVSSRNGSLTLLHNNYHFDKNDKRVLENTFHIQIENIKSFRLCVNHMVKYSFDKHTENYLKTHQNEEEKKHRAQIQYEFTNNAFIENYLYMNSHYLFCDKFIYLDCTDYFADYYFNRYKVKLKLIAEYIVPDTKYRWIICKVSKKHYAQFSTAMKKLSRKMFSEGNLEYFDVLKDVIHME